LALTGSREAIPLLTTLVDACPPDVVRLGIYDAVDLAAAGMTMPRSGAASHITHTNKERGLFERGRSMKGGRRR
jgi:hypothetical protein